MLRGGKEANEEIDYDFPDNQKAGYIVCIFWLNLGEVVAILKTVRHQIVFVK